ncbi:hypothetical protein LUZ60_013441 [Juncus effusus]|nr:hypothetical protein LUZ60_013441 [Juncus effusus]
MLLSLPVLLSSFFLPFLHLSAQTQSPLLFSLVSGHLGSFHTPPILPPTQDRFYRSFSHNNGGGAEEQLRLSAQEYFKFDHLKHSPMVEMEETVMHPPIGRVNLCDLTPNEGLPSDSYKLSISTLTESLSHYSAAIIKLPRGDASLVQSCLDSACLYFHQLGYDQHEESTNRSNNSTDWTRTTGYSSDPQLSQETFDYRPGLTLIGTAELSPSALPEVFSILGKASRDILEAISFSLNLQSCSFNAILDNTPLRNSEISSSVLSVSCHSRPSFQAGQVCPIDYEQQVDKTLITIVKSEKACLNVKDSNGFWVLVDENLGPQELVVYAGLALYQLTAGGLGPAMYRSEVPAGDRLFGRCSVSFKLMPKSMGGLSTVDDFIQQRSFKKSGALIMNGQDGSFKNSPKKKETNAHLKPLPPSKRLRLEAQRVLREKVQEIAEKKGIKLKFCSPKQCENHMRESNSSCLGIRAVLGWPPSVPFVHPHDLPNKAKIAFLEAFEPGWTASHHELEDGTP